MSSGSSPISSRKMRAAGAPARRRPRGPRRRRVNAPRTWPKSSLSTSVGGDGAAVEHDEGPRRPAALAAWMAAREDALARARLALEQHRALAPRDPRQGGEDAPHRGARPEQGAEAVVRAQRLADLLVARVDAQGRAADAQARAALHVALAEAHGADPRAVGRSEVAQEEALRGRADAEVVARDRRVDDDEIVGERRPHAHLGHPRAVLRAAARALDDGEREAVEAELARRLVEGKGLNPPTSGQSYPVRAAPCAPSAWARPRLGVPPEPTGRCSGRGWSKGSGQVEALLLAIVSGRAEACGPTGRRGAGGTT